MALFIILAVIGALLAIVGGLMLIIAAFRQSIWWGLAYIFVPLAALVFLFKHWAEAKTGFFMHLIGALLILPLVFHFRHDPRLLEALAQRESLRSQPARREFEPTRPLLTPGAELPPAPSAHPATDLAAKRTLLEAHANQLKARYEALQARRALLRPGDNAAVERFNREAAEYQAERKRVDAERIEFEALQSR